MRGIDRRRYGHDDEVGLGEHGRVGVTAELRGGTQILGRDLAGRVAEFAVGCNLLGRQVEAEGAVLLAELHGERESDVTEPDDGDGGHVACSL